MVKINRSKRIIRAKSSVVRIVPETPTVDTVSPVFNTRRTKTALRTDEFKSAPTLVFTERDLSALLPLYSKHGSKAFKRGNTDSGILNRAVRKGVLRLVSGEANSERAQLQFVRKP